MKTLFLILSFAISVHAGGFYVTIDDRPEQEIPPDAREKQEVDSKSKGTLAGLVNDTIDTVRIRYYDTNAWRDVSLVKQYVSGLLTNDLTELYTFQIWSQGVGEPEVECIIDFKDSYSRKLLEQGKRNQQGRLLIWGTAACFRDATGKWWFVSAYDHYHRHHPSQSPAALKTAASDAVRIGPSEDDKIRNRLKQLRQEMVRVTEKPVYVVWANIAFCNPPAIRPHSPHGEHWIHVFVSPEGTNVMMTGKGTYPEGTIILKQKFLDAAGTNTDFYTGMRKRERGYNPELGDWEFFTLDSTGYTVTARGKIESCMDCHTRYPTTDFVSRHYVAKPGESR